ncbi:ribosome-inactivating family protein [Streptomyces sp. NPDC059639]|uniref:ribosome-inactivating family protein n=1 Tax=Streptomyces sp. NPDC059639 TaxID=3346891 RepID=UPI00368D0B05
MTFVRSTTPPSGRMRLSGLVAVLLAMVAGLATFLSAQPAAADTGEYRISHVYVNMSRPWADQGRMSKDWGAFLQSIRTAAGHSWRGETSITQNVNVIPHALLRADINVTNAAGHQTELRLWFTPNDLYLRGFTTTSVDASSADNANVTYWFRDSTFNLPNTMENLRSSPDSGLLPPPRYSQLPYGGSYGALRGADASHANTQMSYEALYNSVFQLAYVPRNTTQIGGDNYRTTAASLFRMIQVTSEAARLRDVQGMIIQMMADHSRSFTVPALQQELELDWSHLSDYAWNNTDAPGHYVGPHVPYVTTVARALGYLAIALYPNQGSGPK